MPRLRRVGRDDLTIERRRVGKGFAYFGPGGRRKRDKALLARVRALGVPPAWTDVRIAADQLAHLQAVGTDAAGRLQYIYHADWERRRTLRKQKHLRALAEALPRVRRRVRRDLAAKAGEKSLALAVGVALIDSTSMRIGRERYMAERGTRGAGTLLTKDVAVKGERIELRFPAKSGRPSAYAISDRRLASAIARLKSIPGKRLLMFVNGDGKARPLRTDEINAYLQEITGAPVTAKDFRTLHASALAGEALAAADAGESATARRRQVAAVIKQVATFLQNTPAICRKSYVAPCLVDLHERGKLAAAWAKAGKGGNGMRQREVRLAAVLAAA